MKKLKKMMAVCVFSLASSLIMSTSTLGTSKLYAYFSYKANNGKEVVGCFVAGELTSYAIDVMLLGTGAPGAAIWVCKTAAAA